MNEELNRKMLSSPRNTKRNTDLASSGNLGSQGSTGKNKTLQFTTKERTQCIENDRYLMTRKIKVENLPKELADGANCNEPRDEKGNIIYDRDDELRVQFMQRVEQIRVQKKQEAE